MFAGNITCLQRLGDHQRRPAREPRRAPGPGEEVGPGRRSAPGKVSFAIIVTAEVLPGTVLPSELVVFTSGKVDDTKTTAKNAEFSIEMHEPDRGVHPARQPVHRGHDLRGDKGTEPIELEQADKACNMAVELKAETVAPKEMETARTQLRAGAELRQGRLQDDRRRLLAARPRQRRHGRADEGAGNPRPASRGRRGEAQGRRREEAPGARGREGPDCCGRGREGPHGGRGHPHEGRAGAAEGRHPGGRREVHAGRGVGPRSRHQHGRHPVRREQVHAEEGSRAGPRQGLGHPRCVPEGPGPRRRLHGHDGQGRAQHEALGRTRPDGRGVPRRPGRPGRPPHARRLRPGEPRRRQRHGRGPGEEPSRRADPEPGSRHGRRRAAWSPRSARPRRRSRPPSRPPRSRRGQLSSRS